MHKFRTMIPDAEAKTGVVVAGADDPRITRVGKFLRKSRLDELPQFWDVLRGKMSLVGPRPERPELLQDLSYAIPLFEERMRDVKPGITGLAQISLGYTGSIPEGSEIGKLAVDAAEPVAARGDQGLARRRHADQAALRPRLHRVARALRHVPAHRARHHLQDAARDAEDDAGPLTGGPTASSGDLRPRAPALAYAGSLSSMPHRLAAIALVAASVTTARAQPRSTIEDKVLDTVEQARRLHRQIGALVDLAYVLSEPEALRVLPAQLYGELLADPIMGPVVRNLGGLYRGGIVRVDLSVGASADLDVPGAITGAIDAAWELPLCRVLGAAASGLAGYDGEALGSSSLMVAGCLPLPANTIQVAYTRRDNVRTTLLQRPVVLRDRRTSDIVDGQIRFYRWSGPADQIDVAPIDIYIEHSRSAQGAGLGAWTSLTEFAPVQWRRRGKGLAGGDQVYEFMQLRAWDLRDDGSARFSQAVRLSPLTVDGIHVGPMTTVGFDLGVVFGQSYDQPGGVLVDLVKERGLHAEVNIKHARGPASGELRATHTMLPLFDGQVARDDRIAGRLGATRPPYAARVEGFIARATVLRDLPGGRSLLLGGGAADVSWAAHPRVFVTGRVEAARSLTAGLASEPVGAVVDVRATLGVSAHYGARW